MPGTCGTVLVVDDNELVRETTAELLRAHGAEALCAGCGEEGLTAALKHLPDLILLDIEMPGIDGWEVHRRLREDSRTSTIPVMIVTGSDIGRAQAKGAEQGVAGVLSKPFTRDALTAVMTTLGS